MAALEAQPEPYFSQIGVFTSFPLELTGVQVGSQ